MQSLEFKNLFLNEHYYIKYCNFINACKNKNFIGYTEKHHIVPRSLLGSDTHDNLIKLGARYHYIAHIILAKGTNNPKMIKALHKMAFSKSPGNQRNYRITSKIYEYLRIEHSKIVSAYSKNTVTAIILETGIIARIPKEEFVKFKNIKYRAVKLGIPDSKETKLAKSKGNLGRNTVNRISRENRSLSASKNYFITPFGICNSPIELYQHYPTFTHNTLIVLNNNTVISKKFAWCHNEFKPFIGKTFAEYGLIKKGKNDLNK